MSSVSVGVKWNGEEGGEHERGGERCPPVHGIVDLSVHDHGFKHWAFTHHKLDHSVDEREQIPRREAQLRQTDSDWPHASSLQQQAWLWLQFRPGALALALHHMIDTYIDFDQ